MSEDIRSIKEKYNVDNEGAGVILDTAMSSGKPLHIIASFYNLLSDNGKRKVTGAMMMNKLHEHELNKIRTRQQVGTKDDHSTKGIMNSFTIGKREEGQPGRYISTRQKLEVDGKEEKRVPQRIVPPKYYYFDIDLNFDFTGHDRPPAYDKQFRGFHEGVPYVRVTIDKIISPSRYPIETVEINEKTGEEKIVKKLVPGYKKAMFDIFYGAGKSQSIPFDIPYQANAEFDIIAGRTAAKKSYEILLKTMTPQLKEYYKAIRDDKKAIHIMDVLDTSDIDRKLTKEKMFKEYYGSDYKEERKRKSVKPSSKRKNKRKIIKKKCVCPSVHKRRVTAIKKKLGQRVRKK
jgi:hypothetical protein